MEKLKLDNRDGFNNYLVEFEENTFEFVFDSNSPTMMNACPADVSDKDCKEYTMIDPCGGPQIIVGNQIDRKHIIDKIYFDNERMKFVIKTKKQYD